MRRRSLQALVAGVGLSASFQLPARADEIDTLGGKVVEIDARIRELEAKLRPEMATLPGPEIADRRLIDAQVLYELKNYEACAIILLDVVDKYPTAPAYPEALFFLADSLFLKRDFFSSRRYFEKIVEVGPSTRRYQEALQRLIELSLYTGDYTPVDGYIAKLQAMPPGRQLPSVPYVKGKYYYFRMKYDDADKAFADIGPDHIYWFHSQYFIGAGLVARHRLGDAINVYTGILRVEAKTDSQKRIAELAHMALGRIYYDQAQFTNAFTEYSKISQRSDLFGDALYEQAWVSIKAKDYTKAYRALDLLLTVKPDDPIVPEVKLLIGNLQIRQNDWDKATDSFTKARDEFEPIKKQLEARNPADAQAFFKDLLQKNMGRFDTSTYLPPLAARWVQSEPDVERVVSLVGDVGDLKKSLDESEEIVRRLEKAVDGPQKINVFPELAHARAQAIEFQAQLADAEKKLLDAERTLEGPVAGPERSQLEALAGQRARLEAAIAPTPTDADSVEARQKRIRESFNEVDKRATELNVLIQSYAAVRTALEVYLREQKVDGAKYQSDLAEARATEEGLRRQYEDLRRDIADAAEQVGVDDADMAAQTELRRQLTETLQQEHDLRATIRTRLQGNDRVKADQIDSILVRVRETNKTLTGFNARIDASVDDRLKDIKTALASEKDNVAKYRGILGGYTGETIDVGSGVTAESYKLVTDRFYQIVVRADVGIIDVAWALKQNKTDEGGRLVREEKRELKLLDDEFKQVLKE